MTLRIVLLCGPTPEAPLRWAVGDDADLIAAGGAPSLSALPSLPGHDELVVVLPGERVATRALPLPVPDRQVEGAAALAFADILAEPVDGFAYAWTPAEEGKRRVSAAPAAWLDGWLAALAEAGLDPDLVTADHAALAQDRYDGVVLHDNGRIVASLPGGGLTAAEAFAGPLIEHLAEDAALLSVRIGPSGEAIGSQSLVLADGRALGAFYLQSLAHRAPANFRRGARAKRRDWNGALKGWGPVGGLMAACLALWLAGDLVTGLRYDAAADRLSERATERFTEAYPGTRILDLERQARSRAGGGSGSVFLPLSAALAAALEDEPGVTLTGLSYDAGGRLVADISYTDFAAAEAVADLLRARGLDATEGSSPQREQDGSYTDRLVLTAGAAS